MTDELLTRLRKTCNDAPPRIDGRRVSLDPKIVIALLDEIEALTKERDAMKSVVDALDKHERQYQGGNIKDDWLAVGNDIRRVLGLEEISSRKRRGLR
jgi:hypothetical protein